MTNKKNSPIAHNVKTAFVKRSKHFLFLKFNCPHCGSVNVLNHEAGSTELVLCSHTGCRRVIHLKHGRNAA